MAEWSAKFSPCPACGKKGVHTPAGGTGPRCRYCRWGRGLGAVPETGSQTIVRLTAALARAEARAERCGVLLESIAANWHLLMHPRPLLSGDVRGEMPACDYYPCPASCAALAPDGERPAETEGERTAGGEEG